MVKMRMKEIHDGQLLDSGRHLGLKEVYEIESDFQAKLFLARKCHLFEIGQFYTCRF